MENALSEGEIKTTGTDIDRLMPPLPRFGKEGARAKKKQMVIDKLESVLERFFGIGCDSFTEREVAGAKIVHYADLDSDQQVLMFRKRSPL